MKTAASIIIFGGIGMGGWHLYIKLVNRIGAWWDRKTHAIPGLPRDGEPLTDKERAQWVRLSRNYGKTARETGRRP